MSFILSFQDDQQTDFSKLIDQISRSEIVLYQEYTKFKDNETKTYRCIQNLEQASLILNKINMKKKFFASYSSVKKRLKKKKKFKSN